MKIYLNKIRENWIVDRFYKEWYKYNSNISTKFQIRSDIIWLIAPWVNNVNHDYLENKKTVCTIHHIDFDKFNYEEEKKFYIRDKFVDAYHAVSKKTKSSLIKLTDKKIYDIPFWVNQNIFYEIVEKDDLKQGLGIDSDRFLVGTFQRDTEGLDREVPKLSKGPDRLLDIYQHIHQSRPNLSIVLTGYRREYMITELKKRNIHYYYFPKVNFSKLNKLYNILDLYIVASRVEGGPASIMEASLTKTPLISTNVGLASEILHKNSIFKFPDYLDASSNFEYAYNKTQNFLIPQGFEAYRKMFKEIAEINES